MSRTLMVVPLVAALALASCSSSPDEPVNQTMPIRAMDDFFRSFSPSRSPPVYAQQPVEERRSDYTPVYVHGPGYAPAYPPLDP